MIAAVLGSVTAARASDPDLEGKVELRAIETLPDRWVLDADGDELDWGPAVDTRIRAHGEAHQGPVRAIGEIDVLSGQLVGSTWNLGPLDERGRSANDALGLAGVTPRVASVGARLPFGDLEAGLTTSEWGLGMIANDGATDPLFGRTDFGDRVLRLRFATAPFGRSQHDRVPLYVILAGDRVVSDELARLSDRDHAWQGVLAVLYREEAATDDQFDELGLYGVVRDQRDEDRLHTGVRVVDAYGKRWVAIRGPTGVWDLSLGAEAAAVVGRTEAAASYAAPTGLPVRAGGLTVRTALSDPRERLVVHGNLALASGDRSPDDGRVGDFRFDRDYDVGFVLFDELLADLDLGAYHQATDPSVVGRPPLGVDTLVAEGAFHQAFALQPAVEVGVTPWLRVRAGTVVAWSTAPIAQPFTTFRNGGVPSNHLGLPTDGRYLGTELDWGVSTRPDPISHWPLVPSVDLQVGHAWPSAELAPAVGRLDHVLLVGRVTM